MFEHEFDSIGAMATQSVMAGSPALSGMPAVPAGLVQPDESTLTLPVLAALQPLVPGLRRGQTIEVEGGGALALALVAGASEAGSWCGVVGWPACGVLAAAELRCDLQRLLLVDEPKERWTDVVATLLDAVDIVLVKPPSSPAPGVIRRLSAISRRSGSCLIVMGSWEGAALKLRVDSSLWTGVEKGHGHLRGRRVKVTAAGRGRPRSAWLWLPGPSGEVAAAELTAVV